MGDTISGSSGSPSGYYANPAIYILASSGVPTITGFRIVYAQQAVYLLAASLQFYNGQIVNCQNGFCGIDDANGHIRNVLFSTVQTNFNNLYTSSFDAQNATFNSSAYLTTIDNVPYQTTAVNFKNCIMANVTNIQSIFSYTNLGSYQVTGSYNGFYICPEFGTNAVTNSFYPFQTVGGGSYYLTNGCVFTNAGTANIDPILLTNLQAKTTHCPIAYTNITFTNAQIFNPQALRDTNATPDLGYHYDPLDYSFGGCIADSNITFTAGTAVGWFRTSSGWYHAGYGIHMSAGVTVSFNGTVTAPTYWVRLDTVQEQDLTAGYGPAGIDSWTDVNSPTVIGCFLKCSNLTDDNTRYFSDDYGHIVAQLTDCEFWTGTPGVYEDYMYYTNCLMWRVGMWLDNGSPTSAFTLRNCTFLGGSFQIVRDSSGPTPVSVRDCAFDGTSISTSDYWGSNTNYSDYDYNAYTNGMDPFSIGGAHDVIVTNGFNWQSSWFGNYYQSTNSPLLYKGNVLASQLGLYHFTIQTNQVPDGTNVVSIGYHYVATDQYGNPLDSNGDGIPDYLEDANGDGIYDTGDLGDWQNLNLNVIITRPRNGSLLP
jgi:hypothetical protein